MRAPMLQRILVPLDGSPFADRILEQVERLLVSPDQALLLLTVLPAHDDPTVHAQARRDAEAHLTGVRDRLRARGVSASFEVMTGDPAEAIAGEAGRLRADLVVMATHGRSGPARWVRGSVAEEVIRRSLVPVLSANPTTLEVTPGGAPFRRILVPLDGSDLAMDILPLVEGVAKRCQAEVLLLGSDESCSNALEYLRAGEQVKAALEPVVARLRAGGIEARALAGVGPAAVEIVDAAERERVDLVAMSTHGRSGASRWIFGSVAEQVLRSCTRPLLVRRVHPGAEGGVRPGAHELSVKEMIGASVKDLTLSDLGTVDDLIVDERSGRIVWAVLAFGGILGAGEKLFPVPWSRLHWRSGDRAFVLQHHGKSRGELEQAPHVPRRHERDRTWLQALAPAVHSFYPGARL